MQGRCTRVDYGDLAEAYQTCKIRRELRVHRNMSTDFFPLVTQQTCIHHQVGILTLIRIRMETSAPNSSFSLQLPPELWTLVLKYVAADDIVHLWATCRNVSGSFRKMSVKIFEQTYKSTMQFLDTREVVIWAAWEMVAVVRKRFVREEYAPDYCRDLMIQRRRPESLHFSRDFSLESFQKAARRRVLRLRKRISNSAGGSRERPVSKPDSTAFLFQPPSLLMKVGDGPTHLLGPSCMILRLPYNRRHKIKWAVAMTDYCCSELAARRKELSIRNLSPWAMQELGELTLADMLRARAVHNPGGALYNPFDVGFHTALTHHWINPRVRHVWEAARDGTELIFETVRDRQWW
ncbi:hypothetical protein BDV96DRAFT_575269 [Lophiotrema nucula]|uniref:F-box domain-containing protein n=1 Tax=Lophiotrema nucula TaxID=690887 RepID=A0A6A5Z991_9PLEO|nr:hypothetical protein BDV96DRAFT_575269 [Lophiotrema nucula]